MDGTVLIADDDRTIRTVLTQALSRAGCRVHATGSLGQLLRWVEEGRGDLVVTDVMMPDGNGIDMIPAIRRQRPDLPVIVISAQNTIVTAIRATEAEAFDYLPKPFDLPDLMGKAGQALSRRARKASPPATDQAAAPPQPLVEQADPALPLIGHAPVMQAMFRMVARVLNADLPVLISGEAGVGKTMVARSFHDYSDRRNAEMVVLTAADLNGPDGGSGVLARAGQSARDGTVLVENPAALEPAAQARLVSQIEIWESGPERRSAPRIVSTLGPSPEQDVASGRLRADLYYRLAGITITVPPLRTRVDDIPQLARHLLARTAAQGMPSRGISEKALALIRAHPFPGNVRELENLVRRLSLMAASDEITETEVREALAEQGQSAVTPERTVPPGDTRGEQADAIAPATNGVAGASQTAGKLSQSVEAHIRRYFDLHGDQLPPPGLYDRILKEIERPLLEIALDATAGNQLRCADLLGINRNTLRKKLTDLNIEVTRRRKLM